MSTGSRYIEKMVVELLDMVSELRVDYREEEHCGDYEISLVLKENIHWIDSYKVGIFSIKLKGRKSVPSGDCRDLKKIR